MLRRRKKREKAPPLGEPTVVAMLAAEKPWGVTFEVGEHKRLYVSAVESDGHAARAGLRPGLVLASVNGKAAGDDKVARKLLKRKVPLELALCEPAAVGVGGTAPDSDTEAMVARLRKEKSAAVAKLAATNDRKGAVERDRQHIQEAANLGKLRQHQPRAAVVVNNANQRVAGAAPRPAGAAAPRSGSADAAAAAHRGPDVSTHIASPRERSQERRAQGPTCCGSRPKQRPMQPQGVRQTQPKAERLTFTVSVHDFSNGQEHEPVHVRLTADDLRIDALRHRLDSVLPITDDTRLQCLAGDQWLTVLSGQDQLLLDVLSENGGSTLTIRLQAGELKARPQDSTPSAERRSELRNSGDPLEASEVGSAPAVHRLAVQQRSPVQSQVASSGSEERPMPSSDANRMHVVEMDAANTSDSRHSKDFSVPVNAELHSPARLAGPTATTSVAASSVSWSPNLEQTFDSVPHMNSDMVATRSISGANEDASTLRAVHDISARLGQVEAELQGRSMPDSQHTHQHQQEYRYDADAFQRASAPIGPSQASPRSPRPTTSLQVAVSDADTSYRDEQANKRLTELGFKAAEVQDELRRAREARLAVTVKGHESEGWRRQRASTPNSSLQQASVRPATRTSPQSVRVDTSYRDEQANKRLTELGFKAAEVQDELRRAREARLAVTVKGHESEGWRRQRASTPNSSLQQASVRPATRTSPQSVRVDTSYRDEQANKRLTELGFKAAEVQDELRRAREARLAVTVKGLGSEASFGLGATSAAAVDRRNNAPEPLTDVRMNNLVGSPTQIQGTADPRDIAHAQLANLRADFAQLVWRENGLGAHNRGRNVRKTIANDSRGTAQPQPHKLQVFNPKLPRGASFGATRQARFPHDDIIGTKRQRSIRRGSPTYDWTFE